MLKYALILSVTLTGCATEQSVSKLDLDPYFFKSCEPLPKLDGTKDVQVLHHEKLIIEAYASCSKMNRDKSEVLKKVAQ